MTQTSQPWISDWKLPIQLEDGILDIAGGESPILSFSGVHGNSEEVPERIQYIATYRLTDYQNPKDFSEDEQFSFWGPELQFSVGEYAGQNFTNTASFNRSWDASWLPSGKYQLASGWVIPSPGGAIDWIKFPLDVLPGIPGRSMDHQEFESTTGIKNLLEFEVVNIKHMEDSTPPELKGIIAPPELANKNIQPETSQLSFDFIYTERGDWDEKGSGIRLRNYIYRDTEETYKQGSDAILTLDYEIFNTILSSSSELIGDNIIRFTFNLAGIELSQHKSIQISRLYLWDKGQSGTYYENSRSQDGDIYNFPEGVQTSFLIHDSINDFSLDVDGDGRVGAFSDGLMVIRKLLGASFNGDKLTDKAKAGTASLSTSEIHDFIQAGIDSQALDLDRDGRVTAFGDGLMLIRSMLGSVFNGEKLIDKALSPNSPYYGQADAWQSVKANIDALMPEQPVA